MSATTARGRKFEFGRTLEQTFAVTRRNFLSFYLVALMLSSVPTMIIETLVGALTSGDAAIAATPTFILSLVTNAWVQAALAVGTMSDLNGRTMKPPELLRQVPAFALPVLTVSILASLGIALGLLLLIIPGVLLAIRWCAIVPVTVTERLGASAALARSSELTRGAWGPIFGLMMLFLVPVLVELMIDGALTDTVGAGVLHLVVVGLVDGLIIMLGAVGAAVMYAELRAVKEGARPDTLAAVFD